MPLKTNVGLSRKVGDSNYGSRGASVNLEVELDSSLLQEPERLLDRIRQLFRLAQQSVDEELSRQDGTNAATRCPKRWTTAEATSVRLNGCEAVLPTGPGVWPSDDPALRIPPTTSLRPCRSQDS